MAVLIVMGVSGSGKTTLGQRLAAALGWDFIEGDDLHPQTNVDKMAQRIALTDADRQPWLEAIRQLIANRLAHAKSAVISCSALKQRYRDYLRAQHAELSAEPQNQVAFVYLRGSFEQIRERLVHRKGHYMPVDLLISQFQTLEEPTDAITVDISLEPGTAVQEVLQHLKAIGLTS